MTDTDTSAEAVERLAAEATHEPWEVDALATLRALLAERDAARAEVARLRVVEISARNVAVERLARWHEAPPSGPKDRATAATLRALMAERDEAIARGNDWCDQAQKARAEAARLRVVEISARNVAVNANRGNDGVSAVPGSVIDDLRAALAKEPGHE